MKVSSPLKRVTAPTVLSLAIFASNIAFSRKREEPLARVTLHAGQPGCSVELDAAPAGKTNAQGDFVFENLDPADHYIHVRCAGQSERAYFVSPHPGQAVDLQARPDTAQSTPSPLKAAEAKMELRKIVLKAVQERARGEFDAAVSDLHEAAKLDPENSDLHRELGITFLLQKDWKRARVEMLEAIKHNPTDADAHNGLGYALDKMGATGEALEEFRTATQLDPDDPSYREHYLEALVKVSAQRGEKER